MSKFCLEKKQLTQKDCCEKWASIDPGLSGTGYAVWEKNTLITSGSLSGSRNVPNEDRAGLIGQNLSGIFYAYSVRTLYYEKPWASAVGSEIGAIALQKGDSITLAISTGIMLGICYENPIDIVIPVPVRDWKGMLKKQQSTLRVISEADKKGFKFSSKTPQTHEIDAVGIGLHILGVKI